MAAASTGNCRTVTYNVPAPDPNSAEGTTETFIVPEGVTSIGYTVIGGAGGGWAIEPEQDNWLRAVLPGSGALVTGEIPVTSGQALTLIVGQGGGLWRQNNVATVTGGKGYGDGGDALAPTGVPSNSSTSTGSGGGGGSAILSGGRPLVVAGGGGGAGAGYRISGAYRWTESGGNGGNAGEDAEDWTLQLISPVSRTFTIPGGSGAIGATPGAAGLDPTSPTPGVIRRLQSGTAGNGRNGADGKSTWDPTSPHLAYRGGSGGGGGGYAGGGSAGTVIAGNGIPNTSGYIAFGGPGGGGSSYVDPSATGVVSLAGNTDRTNRRNPGSIMLTYEICD
ncbi:glycine-rich protein [Arenibacterium sp. S380]